MRVYDAGLLIAADRGVREVWADHRVVLETGVPPTTTAPVVAQVSRDGSRQSLLSRLLRGCSIVDLASHDAHEVGALLGRAGGSDVVDAHVVLIASRVAPTTVLTSDPEDIKALVDHIDPRVAISIERV